MTSDAAPVVLPRSVLWFDPGKTTGWAGYALDEHGNPDFQSGQCDGLPAVGEFLLDWLLDEPSAMVGWESYIVTSGGGRSGDPKYSLKVIGALEWLCHREGARVLPEVPAASRVVCSTAVLKRMRWYAPGKPHANDAARHLVAWLLRERLITDELRAELFTD